MESESDLRVLGEQASKQEQDSLTQFQPSGTSREMTGLTETFLAPEIHETLGMNPSIYDLTIQYSCLAFHDYGGTMGFPGLITVIALQLANVFLQMHLLLQVDDYIAHPAMMHAQNLYQSFTDHCYGEDAEVFVFSDDVKSNFESWDDEAKAELCRFPLTRPSFFSVIILIWTFFLGHELKQTLYFFWHTMRLDSPLEKRVTILRRESTFVITHLSLQLKVWVSVIVFVPKVIIALVLWYIGARWLTATPGIDNLMLNSLALTFICELDELLFRTCISETSKACLEQTKLPLPAFKYTPTVWGPIETVSTFLACLAITGLYVMYFQNAIPSYRWDLADLCRGSTATFSTMSHGHNSHM